MGFVLIKSTIVLQKINFNRLISIKIEKAMFIIVVTRNIFLILLRQMVFFKHGRHIELHILNASNIVSLNMTFLQN